VRAIRVALDDQRAAAVSDPGSFLARDMAFHRAIAAVSGNAIYRALSQALFEWLGEFHTEMVRLTGAESLTLREHARILRRIEAHDVDGAARAMTEHLTRANALYRIFERPALNAGTAS
jgi:DNA-binding FadR family transcriptional regulator